MKYFKILILVSVVVLSSCTDKEHSPLVSSFEAPPLVQNVKVDNLPGAAKISYSLPKSDNLLYVAAEFENEDGDKKVVKSSQFQNWVLLEGFSNEQDYMVNLYSVSKSEKYSAPVQVTVHPTRPPVKLIEDSLRVSPTFGGITLQFKNRFDMDVVVYTLIKNDQGEWEEFNRFYTGSEDVQHSVRDLQSQSIDFAFYIQDEWNNHSDTLFTTLTPLYEEEVDKSLWKDAELLDDFNYPMYGPLSNLWTPGSRTYFFQDYRNHPDLGGMPTWITIDFGKKYILGRMKLFMVKHAATWQYSSCSVKRFEIWGSNYPTTDWNDWTLLGEFESHRPSGRSVGEPLTDDDLNQLQAGEDFTFPPLAKSYRYIRFKVLETYGHKNYFCSLELSFWGQAD